MAATTFFSIKIKENEAQRLDIKFTQGNMKISNCLQLSESSFVDVPNKL